MKKNLTLLTTGAVAALLLMSPARADLVGTGSFTSDHCTGGCLTGQTKGGTVTVTDHLNGTLDFDIELANGNTFVGTGLDLSFAFNLIGNPTIHYSNLSEQSGTPSSFVLPSGGNQSAGSFMEDGTGTFEYGLDVSPNGHTPVAAGNFLKFSISGTGLDITDLAEVSTGANGGKIMMADIFSGTTGNTGAVDLSVDLTVTTLSVPVPEPASIALLGSALLGLGGLGALRRRRKGKDA